LRRHVPAETTEERGQAGSASDGGNTQGPGAGRKIQFGGRTLLQSLLRTVDVQEFQ